MRQLKIGLAVLAFLAAAGCEKAGTTEAEAPTLFPILQGKQFGFIDARGTVVVQPAYDYWSSTPTGGTSTDWPAAPNGARDVGMITPDDTETGSYDGTSQFWRIAAESATVVSVAVNSSDIDPTAALYELKDGGWRLVTTDDDGGEGVNSLISWSFYNRKSPSLGVLVSHYTGGARSNPGAYEVNVTADVPSRATLNEFLRSLRFSEGLLPYRQADRWGFMKDDGTVAVNPQFDAVGPFAEGLAVVLVKNRQGFIDRTGTLVVQPAYEAAYSFSADRAAVWPSADRCGYIDREGRFVINPIYKLCLPFGSGIGVVVDEDDRWGAVDPEGKVLIAPQFKTLTAFAGDHAGAKITDKYGLVDRTGKVILAPQYDGMVAPEEGALWLVKQGERQGFVDATGKFAVGPTLDEARPFRGGVAAVRMGERWGFVKPDGKFVGGAGPQYEEARSMVNGRAAVRLGRAWGFVDEQGGMVISPAYDAVGDFDGALAAVIKEGRLGYIDRTGKIVREPAL